MKIKLHSVNGIDPGIAQWEKDHIIVMHGLTKSTPIFIEEFDTLIVDSETVLSKGGLGTAVAGGLLFGGAGAIAGAVLGRGNKKTSTIEVTLMDGRAFLADVDAELLTRVKSVLFLLKGKSNEERLEIARLRKEEYKKKRKEKWIGNLVSAVIVIALIVYIGTKVN